MNIQKKNNLPILKTALCGAICFLSIPVNQSFAQSPELNSRDSIYPANINAAPYDPTANPYGKFGSEYSAETVFNKFGSFAQTNSEKSASKATSNINPTILGKNNDIGGIHLERYNAQRLFNPYGNFGTHYSNTSVNESKFQYGEYRNPYGSYDTQTNYLQIRENKPLYQPFDFGSHTNDNFGGMRW